MNPVPQDLLDEIDEAEAELPGAEDAANSALHVMFFMANELEIKPSMPPILSSTGVEVYPLPNPWAYSPPLNIDGTLNTDALLVQVNRWLAHVKTNAIGYNEALLGNNIPTAVGIAQQSAKDSATVWSACNAMAMSITTTGIYSPILLADYVKEIYKSVAGPFPDWPEPPPPEPLP